MDAVENPEKGRLTLFQRLSAPLSLPYAASCVLLTVLIGPPLLFVSALADTNSLDKAFSFTFLTAYGTFNSTRVAPLVGIMNQIFWTASLLVVLYMTGFMRKKLQAYEADLMPLVPAGGETLHKAFGGVFRLFPVLAVSMVLGLTSITYVSSSASMVPGGVTLVFVLISNAAVTVLFASFIWVYFRSLFGLYRLGKEPLQFSRHDKDPMLGLKPVGSISFSLFFSYSAVIGFVTLGLLVVPDAVSLVSIFVLELLGGVMFFLPLNSVHKRMVAMKRTERMRLVQKTSELIDGDAKRLGTEELLKGIREAQFLQLQKDYVSTLPTWPFDTGILGRFAAIILSVIAILLSSIISVNLHL